MSEPEPEFGDYQIRPDPDRKFKCGVVKVGVIYVHLYYLAF